MRELQPGWEALEELDRSQAHPSRLLNTDPDTSSVPETRARVAPSALALPSAQ